jgi:hypothetical protein
LDNSFCKIGSCEASFSWKNEAQPEGLRLKGHEKSRLIFSAALLAKGHPLETRVGKILARGQKILCVIWRILRTDPPRLMVSARRLRNLASLLLYAGTVGFGFKREDERRESRDCAALESSGQLPWGRLEGLRRTQKD